MALIAFTGPRALSVLIESELGSSILFEHDLFGKPVSTFPDHPLVPLHSDFGQPIRPGVEPVKITVQNY